MEDINEIKVDKLDKIISMISLSCFALAIVQGFLAMNQAVNLIK
jgi:hypothetical protein